MSNREERNFTEREFEESWVAVERFFASQIIIYNGARLTPVYRFVWTCNTTFDITKQVRATQAMQLLILSRSLHPRLRPGQPRLAIHARDGGGFRVEYYDGYRVHEAETKVLLADWLDIEPTLKGYIGQLIQQPIE